LQYKKHCLFAAFCGFAARKKKRKNNKIGRGRLGAGIFCSIAPQYFSERNL